MKGKLLSRGTDRNGNEYTRELYGDRGFGPALAFNCDHCGDWKRPGDSVILVEDGKGYCTGCFDALEDAALSEELDYHCGVHPSDWR